VRTQSGSRRRAEAALWRAAEAEGLPHAKTLTRCRRLLRGYSTRTRPSALKPALVMVLGRQAPLSATLPDGSPVEIDTHFYFICAVVNANAAH